MATLLCVMGVYLYTCNCIMIYVYMNIYPCVIYKINRSAWKHNPMHSKTRSREQTASFVHSEQIIPKRYIIFSLCWTLSHYTMLNQFQSCASIECGLRCHREWAATKYIPYACESNKYIRLQKAVFLFVTVIQPEDCVVLYNEHLGFQFLRLLVKS